MNLQSAHDLSKARAAVEQYKQRHVAVRGEQQMTAGWTKRSSLASRNERSRRRNELTHHPRRPHRSEEASLGLLL